MNRLSIVALFLTLISNHSFGQESNQSLETISLKGVLEPVATLRLATRDPGIVTELQVKEGDVVSAGTTIAILDNELYQAELNAAKRELDIALEESKNDIDLQYAKISTDVNGEVLNRSKKANQQFAKTVSGTEIERLRLEYERSRLSGEQANRTREIKELTSDLRSEQVEIARLRLKNRNIKSNIDGTVIEILYSPGEYVSAGYPIARILNLKTLRVKCAGDAKKMIPADIQSAAEFKFKHGDVGFAVPATITFISPEIDPVRQTFAVWAEIDNSDGKLNAGMLGTLDLKMDH